MSILARYKSLAIGAMLLLAASCAHTSHLKLTTQSGSHDPGSIANVERLGGHSATTLRLMSRWAGLPHSIRIEHGVTLYRIEYWTKNYDGSPTVASGLFALPHGKGELKGVVSYQHGTNPSRSLTPSRPTLAEGVLGSAIFGGGGYLYVAPDYIGLGTSHEMHPYFHTPSTVGSVVDMLRASNSLCAQLNKKWPDAIYLTGFSQGGQVTIATHKQLEQMNEPQLHLVASAPVAPPCDLPGTSFPFALENHGTFYLSYMSNSYCKVYGHPIDTLLVSPYAQQVPVLFDGDHKPGNFEKVLPKNAREIFTKDFLDAYDAKQPTWLLTAIAENAIAPWPCKAPMRVYYGAKDMDVSPKEEPAFVSAIAARGGNASVVCVGDYAHDESVTHAIPFIRQWFDEMAEAQNKN